MNDHPAHNYSVVTPDDGADLPAGTCRALFIGTSGNVALYARGTSTAVVFKNLGSGAILPVGASRVLATSTTAADIVALY